MFSKLHSPEELLKCVFMWWGTLSYDNVCKSQKVDSEKHNSITANLLSKTLICKKLLHKSIWHCTKKNYYFSSLSRKKLQFFAVFKNFDIFIEDIYFTISRGTPNHWGTLARNTSIQHWFRLPILGCGPGMLYIYRYSEVFTLTLLLYCARTHSG